MQFIKKINKDNWFGIKIREIPDYNYKAIWNNLITTRFDRGNIKELPIENPEFIDVGISSKCETGKCMFCYVNASDKGEYFSDICNTWRKWMNTYHDNINDNIMYTDKVFQIAIGSTGEPTEHPQFCDFLKTVYETNVVPNYTTNGVILSYYDMSDNKYYYQANKILEYTSKYVGGVAVSYGNKYLRKYADKAIDALLNNGNCHVMIHHIISDNASVDDFINCYLKYKDKIKNHVLLPLMPNGRSKNKIKDESFEYLLNKINEYNIDNVAFGANFIPYLNKTDKVKTWLFPPESYSKNVLIKNNEIIITPSSFNLNPLKIIKL